MAVFLFVSISHNKERITKMYVGNFQVMHIYENKYDLQYRSIRFKALGKIKSK